MGRGYGGGAKLMLAWGWLMGGWKSAWWFVASRFVADPLPNPSPSGRGASEHREWLALRSLCSADETGLWRGRALVRCVKSCCPAVK